MKTLQPERCPYCSFDPTNSNDFCDEHKPKSVGGNHLAVCKSHDGKKCDCGLSQPKQSQSVTPPDQFSIYGYHGVAEHHSLGLYHKYYLKSEVDAYLASQPVKPDCDTCANSGGVTGMYRINPCKCGRGY